MAFGKRDFSLRKKFPTEQRDSELFYNITIMTFSAETLITVDVK